MSNTSNTLETITQQIDKLEHANAEKIAALEARIQELKAMSESAGAAAEAAFDEMDISKYYARLSEKKTADDECRMIEARQRELYTDALITGSEYEGLVKRISEYNEAERTKAEQAAWKHIEGIRRIAEKSVARSDAARVLIQRLQHDIYREKPKGNSMISRYIQERGDKEIKVEALQTLKTYLCDPTYPTTSFIYTTYGDKE